MQMMGGSRKVPAKVWNESRFVNSLGVANTEP